MSTEDPNQIQEKLNKLSNIEPIFDHRNKDIRYKEDLKKMVEAPLLRACEELYDKNIKTLATSANKNDLASKEAYIIISFDELSKENQKIGRELGEVFFADERNQLKMIFPIDQNTTLEDVERWSLDIAHKFVKQMYRVQTYTLEQMRQIYAIEPNDESFSPESFMGEGYNWYWSPEYKLFFLSKEQYDKAMEQVEGDEDPD